MFADLGLRVAAEQARPGLTERELAAEPEHAMRAAGSDDPCIPTELTSGPRSALVHGTPSHRRLEAADLVHVEGGTAFVLHACLLDEQAGVGVVVGGTYAVTEQGLEQLAGAGPMDLQASGVGAG